MDSRFRGNDCAIYTAIYSAIYSLTASHRQYLFSGEYRPRQTSLGGFEYRRAQFCGHVEH